MKTRIKELRKALHLSQTEFGKRVGVSLFCVQKWESGENTPSRAVQYVICDKFSVSRKWLESGNGEMLTSQNEGNHILTMPERIMSILEMEGISQADFAERIGYNQSTVSMWISGKRELMASTKKLICSEFGISREWLETGQGEMKAPNLPA